MLCTVLLLLTGSAFADPSPQPATLRQAAQVAGLDWPPPDVHLIIDKSDRLVEVWSGRTRLVQWPMTLGGHDRDKIRRGDKATPEGRFKVVTRNEKSSFHLFLGLNYPLSEDADRGLRAGLISEAEANAIREADRLGRLPPWNTRLGGAIGLHGGGASGEWTLGCVAIDNPQIEEIWAVTRHGTVVEIRP